MAKISKMPDLLISSSVVYFCIGLGVASSAFTFSERIWGASGTREKGLVTPEDKVRLEGFWSHRKTLETQNRIRVEGLESNQRLREIHDQKLDEALKAERELIRSQSRQNNFNRDQEDLEEKKRDQIRREDNLRLEALWKEEKALREKSMVPRPFSEEVEFDLVQKADSQRVESRHRNSTFRRSGSAFSRSDGYSGSGGSYSPRFPGSCSPPSPPPPNFSPPSFPQVPPDNFDNGSSGYDGNYYPPPQTPGMDPDGDGGWGGSGGDDF